MPAGKVDQGEDLLSAMVREIKEETEIAVAKSELKYFAKVFVRYPDKDFIYHMFSLKFKSLPDIKLSNSEHQQYHWATPLEALAVPLVLDEEICIKMFYKI